MKWKFWKKDEESNVDEEKCTGHHFDYENPKWTMNYETDGIEYAYNDDGEFMGAISLIPYNRLDDIEKTKTVITILKEKVYKCQHVGCYKEKKEEARIGYVFEDDLMEDLPDKI